MPHFCNSDGIYFCIHILLRKSRTRDKSRIFVFKTGCETVLLLFQTHPHPVSLLETGLLLETWAVIRENTVHTLTFPQLQQGARRNFQQPNPAADPLSMFSRKCVTLASAQAYCALRKMKPKTFSSCTHQQIILLDMLQRPMNREFTLKVWFQFGM